jgi:hypothetical protein
MIYLCNLHIYSPSRDIELEQKLEELQKFVEHKYPTDECDIAFFKIEEDAQSYYLNLVQGKYET